jgi:hypothetical protein
MGEPSFWQTLAHLFQDLAQLVRLSLAFLASWSLLIVWIVWWLWGVNWRRCWAALAQGAWAPAVLLLLLLALVWSRLQPGPWTQELGTVVISVPSFWWQLGAVGALAALALFCGWLQGVYAWEPAELDLEPPVHAHGHDAHAAHH